MIFNSQECAWADVSFRIFGTTVITLRGIKYSKEKEKELLYGAGSNPIGIQEGNVKYEGASIKILKNELTKFNQAARDKGFKDITEIPPQLIVGTVNYKEAFGRPMQTDTLSGIAFTKFEKGMEQGAKMMEVELPFLFLDLDEQ